MQKIGATTKIPWSPGPELLTLVLNRKQITEGCPCEERCEDECEDHDVRINFKCRDVWEENPPNNDDGVECDKFGCYTDWNSCLTLQQKYN